MPTTVDVLSENEPLTFECSGWEVNLAKRELRAHGVAVPLGSRAFEIVETLVRSAGELVTKDDLMARVWPDLVVGENTVQVHISAIRKAFGSDRKMLKTVSGRGYRLLGNWTARRENTPAGGQTPDRAAAGARSFFTNIPMAASALVGRETAVQQLHDLVSAYRVVTLTGPGGIGKTVLASNVARRLLPATDSDIFLIELVSLADPDLVPSAIAYVLDLRLPGENLSSEAVARAIGGRKLFLILDNCEHVIDAAARTAETLVQLCPQLTILATSREALRIEGEFVYRVPALSVPAEDVEASDDMLDHGAVQLFVQRTRSQRADFVLEREILPVVAEICRHLDGIPLAIEFAAARAATLGIEQVARHLDDRFALLTSGRRTALPRHQTLRATLDWSYELLPEAERRLLRYLAVFPAGFTLEAATAVARDSEPNVALGVSTLVAKSLVTFDGPDSGQRWRLLETVRVYALEKLIESGEDGQILRRHAKFYLSLFHLFDSDLQSAIAQLGVYRREVDNLRSALNWAFSPAGDSDLGVELAAMVTDFWVSVSLVAESIDWAVKALAEIGGAVGTRREMTLCCSLGFALVYTQGMSDRARDALLRALALARTLEDIDYQQRATCGLWLFSSRAMALNDALQFARDYERSAMAGDLQSQATAAWLVGVPQTYLALHSEASERLQWATARYPIEYRHRDVIRLGGDVRASALGHNTVNLLSRGLLEAATSDAMRAIEEARESHQPTVLCVALAWAAGFVFLSLEDLEGASTTGEELVKLAHKHALRPFHAVGLCVRGATAVQRREPARGINDLAAGLAEMQAATYLLFYPYFRTHLAAAMGAMGRIEDGLDEIERTLQLATAVNYQWFLPEILRIKAELLVAAGTGDMPYIEGLLRQAMHTAETQAALYWELSAATSLAQLLQRRGDQAEALRVLSPVYGLLSDGASMVRVRRARLLLEQLGRPGSA